MEHVFGAGHGAVYPSNARPSGRRPLRRQHIRLRYLGCSICDVLQRPSGGRPLRRGSWPAQSRGRRRRGGGVRRWEGGGGGANLPAVEAKGVRQWGGGGHGEAVSSRHVCVMGALYRGEIRNSVTRCAKGKSMN